MSTHIMAGVHPALTWARAVQEFYGIKRRGVTGTLLLLAASSWRCNRSCMKPSVAWLFRGMADQHGLILVDPKQVQQGVCQSRRGPRSAS